MINYQKQHEQKSTEQGGHKFGWKKVKDFSRTSQVHFQDLFQRRFTAMRAY